MAFIVSSRHDGTMSLLDPRMVVGKYEPDRDALTCDNPWRDYPGAMTWKKLPVTCPLRWPVAPRPLPSASAIVAKAASGDVSLSTTEA